MSTNFLSLLKSKNTNNNQAIKIDSNFGTPNQAIVDVTPKGYGPEVVAPITVRCERVLDRNRLDLFFSSKPDLETRTMLKEQGFTFRDDRMCWQHKDCLINRLFLADKFGLSELMQDQFNDDLKPEVSSEFGKFRSQVDRLVEHLKISSADLMLQAIECLHDKTFKVN